MPPPLPDSLVLEILGYLLPPAPPLPQHLLADALLQRLTFLPPAADDLDAWISPLPSVGQPLTSRLHELAKEHTLGDAEYSHDGEGVIGRKMLRSEHGDVEVRFAWEDKPDQNEWKFLGVFQTSEGWTTTMPNAPNGEASDYWAGFSPASGVIDLAEPQEDDYWAQYTPSLSRPHSPLPPKDKLLSRRSSEHAGLSIAPLRHTDTLRPRLIQKIKSSLRNAWLEFAEGDAEERAGVWLHIARDLHRVSLNPDPSTAVVRAKLEVLEQMYTLVEEHEDGFYRMAEEAIRKQEDIGRTYSSDQVAYWE